MIINDNFFFYNDSISRLQILFS